MLKIDLLAFDGCLGSELLAVADTLAMANWLCAAGRTNSDQVFDVAIISADGGPRRLAGAGASISARRARHSAWLIVPGLAFADRSELITASRRLEAEHRLIARVWHRGGSVASVCTGAFVLAHTGVLDGRRVTTGWPVADLLQQVATETIVESGELLVRDGRLWTSGALTAAYELALGIVHLRLGDDIARRLRKLLLFDARPGGQSPFTIFDPAPSPSLGFINKVKAKLREDTAEPFNLTALAKYAQTSPRTLQRRFKEQVGETPLHFLQRLRMERARHMLEVTDKPVSRIASEVGYGDEAAFRSAFKRVVGQTPGAYRGRFKIFVAG
jgi:transcriptional regulator GlxA family with amidase domain